MVETQDKATEPKLPASYLLISTISLDSLIPKLPFNQDDKSPSDLQSFFSNSDNINSSRRTENLIKVMELLHQFQSESESNGNDSILDKSYGWTFNLILFLGEQHDGSKPWSCSANERLVSEIIEMIRKKIILKFSDGKNRLEELFSKDFETVTTLRKTVFAQIIKNFKVKLRKDEWRYYPAAIESFLWILKQIKYPNLSPFVDDILPPSLLLTDDYAKDYKLMGIDCLNHSMDNLNKADILKNNWAIVVYDALHKIIHDKDPEVINKLAPTLYRVLSLIEVNPNENCDKMTKYDETMKKLLFTMEFCSELNQKKAWITHLITLIQIMGHATLHWIDRISSLLLSYTLSADSELWLGVLKSVEVCIQNTWLKPSSNIFAEIILRIIFNTSVLTEITGDEIYQTINRCLELMSKCDDFEETRVQIQEILTSCDRKELHPKFLNELDKYSLITQFNNN